MASEQVWIALATVFLRAKRPIINRILTILLIVSPSITNQFEFETPPQAFEELGQVACGLSYAHVHTSINITTVLEEIDDAIDIIDAEVDKSINVSLSKTNTSGKHLKAWWKYTKEELQAHVIPLREIRFRFNAEDAMNNREKRQTDPLGLLASAANFGFELFNSHQISELKKKVETLQQDSFIQSIRIKQDLDTQLQNYSSRLQKILTKMTSAGISHMKVMQTDMVKMHITHMADKVRRQVAFYMEIFYELQQGRLRPTIYEPQALYKTIKKLELKLKSSNHKFLHQVMADFYRFDTSSSYQEEAIHLFTHIPVTSGGIMTLYRMAPIPFLSKEGLLFTLSSNKFLLAVTKDHSHSIALDEGQLSACRKIGRLYYCDSLRVARKSIASTCVGAVFAGIKRAVKANCDIAVSKLGEEVREINRTTFLVMTSHPTVRVQSECKTGSRLVHNQGMVTLQPGCDGFTHLYWFSSGGNYTIPMTIAPSPIHLDEELVPFEPYTFEEVRDFVIETGILEHENREKLKQVQTLMHRQRITHTGHRVLTGLGICAFLGVLISLAVGAYIYYLAHLERQRRKDMSGGFGLLRTKRVDDDLREPSIHGIEEDEPSIIRSRPAADHEPSAPAEMTSSL